MDDEKERKNCIATIEIDFGKYFDKGKKRTLSCCLFAPHKKHKHLNPSVLLTCGGDTIPEKDYPEIKNWSYYIEERESKK